MITLAELDAMTINMGLSTLINANPTLVQKWIDWVTNKMLMYIGCVEQFGDPAVYPDDLKQVGGYLVESLYIAEQEEKEIARDRANGVKSKRIDDFAVEYTQGSVSLFYGIPILPEYMMIIDAYSCRPTGLGFIGVMMQ